MGGHCYENGSCEVIQPDFQSSFYPLSSACRLPPSRRQRQVRFAKQLTVEAQIPSHHSVPLEQAQPPQLSSRELQESIDKIRREISNVRATIETEGQTATLLQEEIESLRHTKQHTTSLTRLAIQETQEECDNLDKRMRQMRMEMEEYEKSKLAGSRRKRRQSQRRLSSESSRTMSPASVRDIWNEPDMGLDAPELRNEYSDEPLVSS